MMLSLVPDFVWMGKQKSTGNMSVMPCVLLFTNCYALAIYSYVIDDIVPLLIKSVLGVIVGGALPVLFYCWTSHKRAVVKVFVVASCVCLSITAYSSLALSGVTQQSHLSISTTLGFITIGTAIGLYASPMATIVRVIRTKTVSSSSPWAPVNRLNSVGYILYSSLVGNMFILAPNIGGIVLGSTQMEGNESVSIEDLVSDYLY